MSERRNVIDNRYEVVAHIGQGGMADVFLAVDTILNRQVAVKILRADLSGDAVSILRFEREAQAATALTHPNIVQIYDVGEYKGHHYIVMEYVPGKTLKTLIKERGNLLVEEAIDIMLQLCSATAEAHSRGIIHRDIKPQNVIVKADGTVKILDFGIATAKGSVQLTQTNAVMGSVHYLAPELAKGEPASPQSDIYALGIVLYEMLAGDVPFKADQPVQIALMHLRVPMPSVRKVRPDVPQSVENIIIRATAKNPSQRYRSCDEMLKDLRTCLRADKRDVPKLVVENLQPVRHSEKKPEEEEVKEPEPKPRKKGVRKWLIILAGIVAAGVLAFLYTNGIFGSKKISVPDLSGMTITEAKEACSDANLYLDTSHVDYTLTTDTQKGQIIGMEPAAGSEVDKGTNITVTVSSGIGVVAEDYTGRNLTEVKQELNQNYPYLKVNVEEQSGSDQSPGTILAQKQLAAGDLFDPSAAAQITLVYASYPTITIPTDIIGKTVQEASSELASYGIVVYTSVLSTDGLSEDQLKDLTYGVVMDARDSTMPKQSIIGMSYTQKEDNYITLYYY